MPRARDLVCEQTKISEDHYDQINAIGCIFTVMDSISNEQTHSSDIGSGSSDRSDQWLNGVWYFGYSILETTLSMNSIAQSVCVKNMSNCGSVDSTQLKVSSERSADPVAKWMIFLWFWIAITVAIRSADLLALLVIVPLFLWLWLWAEQLDDQDPAAR